MTASDAPAPVLPQRPRLAEHALARRHLVDNGEVVVLHDTKTGQLLRLGPREWALLSCADGTRDVEGIALAARRQGARADVATLREFLGQIAALGLLADGLADERAPRAATPPDRPVLVLPDYTLECHGGGSCCRIYATVVFAQPDTARARALRPEVLDGGVQPSRVFLPVHGADAGGVSAVAVRHGGCVYLNDAGLCSIHILGGADAKPDGCSLYPTSFVDDGETVRVSVSPECMCVLASAGRTDGTPLLPASARTRAELPAAAYVDQLPERVALTARDAVPRAQIAAWSRWVAAAPASADTPARLWALAAALEAAGATEAATRRALESPAPLRADAVLPWIDALGVRAAGRAREDARWRSAGDLARRTADGLADVAATLLPRGALARHLATPAAQPAEEALYLRAAVFGHALVGDLPLALALRDAAVRMLVARALPAIVARGTQAAAGPPDPVWAQPLALVEALLRGHGLSAYAYEVEA